jgi:predicted nucleotidyltransferase
MNPIDQLTSPKIKEFCMKNEILKLSLFGSYLKGNQNSNSDIDFLVEFDCKHIPSLLEISKI